MSQNPTPEEMLGNFEGLFSDLKRATPGAPDWYSIIDMAVGVLFSERVDAMRREVAARSPQEGKEARQDG